MIASPRSLLTAAGLLLVGACGSTQKPDTAASDAAAHQAHANYVRVINSNNTDSLMSMVTEDVVYLLHGLGIATGIDLDKLVDAAAFISGALGRKPVSRVANALLAKRQNT